jgi:SAM-dependent methyltransferase
MMGTRVLPVRLLDSVLVSLVYTASRTFTLLPPAITAAKGLSADQKAEKYFDYEVRKARSFDQTFDLSARGKVVLEIGSGFGGYVYHALTTGAAFVYAVECDRVRFEVSAGLLTRKYDANNYAILNADARELSEVPSGTVDLVVSDAVIEHIQQLDRVFREIARVLRPGGRACLSTSPIWYTWNGGHIARYVPIPWAHIVLPDRIIFGIFDRQFAAGDYPPDALNNIRQLYATIGRLSLRKLQNCINGSGLRLDDLRNITRSKLKHALMKLPLGQEVFAGNIAVTLTKPTRPS